MENHTLCKITNWLNSIQLNFSHLSSLQGDASLRRYFRIHQGSHTYILMDTSKEMHYFAPFVQYTALLGRRNIPVPKIYATSAKDGFLLLSDFGDQLLLNTLKSSNVDHAYKIAIDILLNLQTCHLSSQNTLPPYDEKAYRTEIELFQTWYIPYFLQVSLSSKEEHLINDTFNLIIEHILSHPQVLVHRDYHSRNLLWLNNKQLGVIDYQDACIGSIVYDIVSLLKDCYIQWPAKKTSDWLAYFYQKLIDSHQLSNIDFTTFTQWFDWVGLQRHLKCLGIFVRLQQKHNRHYHIQHIPTILNYVKDVTSRYPELSSFNQLLTKLQKDDSQ